MPNSSHSVSFWPSLRLILCVRRIRRENVECEKWIREDKERMIDTVMKSNPNMKKSMATLYVQNVYESQT